MNRRRFLKMSGLVAGGALLSRAATGQADPGAEGSFSFAVLADPHLSEDRQGEASAADKLRAVVAAIGALPEQPDFLLVLGDIHLAQLPPLLPEISLPLHLIAGNHESAAHRKELRDTFGADFAGRDFYGFTHKGCRFLGLCTAMVGDHVGHFESEDITPPVGQVGWLERELRQAAAMAHRFVFGHVPPEPDNQPNLMYMGSVESRWFHELLEREKVSGAFFGHEHVRQEYRVGDTRMYLVPSCNWNFGAHKRGFYLVKVQPAAFEANFIECP